MESFEPRNRTALPALLVFLSLLAACGEKPAPAPLARDAQAGPAEPVAAMDWPWLAARLEGREIQRLQVDARRGRVWVISTEGLQVYDRRTQQPLATLDLPGWLWVGMPHSCPPGLFLGPGGDAVVTSDVMPKVWRVDAESFEATRYEPALDADFNKETGFTDLAPIPGTGGFVAVSAHHGSLWHIDATLASARKIHVGEPLIRTCSLSLRPRLTTAAASPALCLHGESENRTVTLTPDGRPAQVVPESCRS